MKEKIRFESKIVKSSSPIETVVKNLGINYPNDSLGFLHAIYAKVDGKTPNKNGVILAKSVKNDVAQLKMTQVNMNHKRTGYVVGTILDAWVNDDTDEIEIVFSFFKSLYPEEWSIVEKGIDDGEMSVSFELTVDKSDVEYLNGGVRKLNKVGFDGVGLLFPGVAPAYPNAKVLQSANSIVDTIFQNREKLLCASANEAILTIQSAVEKHKELLEDKQKGENIMDKKVKDALMAKFKESITEELGEDAVKEWSDAKWEQELLFRSQKEDFKKAVEEVKTELNEKLEAKDAEIAELKEQAEVLTRKMQENVSYEVKEDTEAGTMEVIEKVQREEEVDGEKKMVEDTLRHTLYSQEKLDEAVEEAKNEVKAEFEEKLQAKEEEIQSLSENAEKIAELKAELGEFVEGFSTKDFSNEEKLENARLKKKIHDLENKDVDTASEKKDEKLQASVVDDEKENGEAEETSEDRISAYLKGKYSK